MENNIVNKKNIIMLVLKILFLLSSAIIYISYDLMATGIHSDFVSSGQMLTLLIPLAMSILSIILYIKAQFASKQDKYSTF